MTPLDTTIRVTYQDGFVLDETELGDISPYNQTQNILKAVLNHDPEQQHGAMVQFSCFYKDNRYDIDWTQVPANAVPIRFRQGFMKASADHIEYGWNGMQFGYQYTDEQGNNHKQIEDIS